MAIATEAVIALAIAKAKTSSTAFSSHYLSLYPFNPLPKKRAKCPSVVFNLPLFLPPRFYRTLHGLNAEALGTTPSEARQQKRQWR